MAKCDFCGAKAKFDGKTVMGPWANMCDHCVMENGYPDNNGLCKVIREPSESKPQELTFDAWLARVNNILVATCEMGYEDLPDYSYHDAYDDGVDPEIVAHDVLAEADFY